MSLSIAQPGRTSTAASQIVVGPMPPTPRGQRISPEPPRSTTLASLRSQPTTFLMEVRQDFTHKTISPTPRAFMLLPNLKVNVELSQRITKPLLFEQATSSAPAV